MKYPVCTISFLACFLWSTPTIVESAKKTDNAIARVVGARNHDDSIWMKLEEDKSAESGWAVNVLRNTNQGLTDAGFWVYMYAKEKNKPSFRHYLFRSVLCALVSTKTKHPKLSFDHFLPTQIMKMILPGRQGGCTFYKKKKAIQAKAPVNANRNDPQHKDVGIPYSFPFDLMVNIVRATENDPLHDFTIQANFTVDLNDKNNEKENNEAIKKVTSIVTDTPINVPARVIDVKNGIKNRFFSAEKNSSSPSGWDIKVVDWIRRYTFDWILRLDLFDAPPNSDKPLRKIFAGKLCDALVYDSRYDGYPRKNYLPRQIVDIIFPGQMGSCDFEKKPFSINKKGTVNLNPFENPDVKLPYSPYFNLIANVKSHKEANDSSDVYFFQVKFTIGEPSIAGNGKPPGKCLNSKSGILEQACESYKAIKSSISDKVKKVTAKG